MANAQAYCVKFNQKDEPFRLFRFNQDNAQEEMWSGPGPEDWAPAEFMDSVAEGSFAYEMTDVKNAQKAFPAAFA